MNLHSFINLPGCIRRTYVHRHLLDHAINKAITRCANTVAFKYCQFGANAYYWVDIWCQRSTFTLYSRFQRRFDFIIQMTILSRIFEVPPISATSTSEIVAVHKTGVCSSVPSETQCGVGVNVGLGFRRSVFQSSLSHKTHFGPVVHILGTELSNKAVMHVNRKVTRPCTPSWA